ncbi:uncharacterized protein [Paramormyrops kingsleyae]|uniref:uncharacterized protein n=1 Tax=Paramormyrops kingsleyae TaxID=1676925 RepID=UPI000CD63FB4|nr:uncharacterized protein LOC111848163 [Paramormyrops kingsleyae]XP_023675721.1 uncharacterized protein LOC111848163 [Paramormyrops kingsleyae]
MTDLYNNSPQQAESQRIGLLQEVIYWLSQPEVQEDPVARDMASRSGDLLSEAPPPGNAYPLQEVRENLRLLIQRITDRRAQLVALCCAGAAVPPSVLTETAQPLPSTATSRRRKKKKREQRQKEDLTILLGAASLSPASFPASLRGEALIAPDVSPDRSERQRHCEGAFAGSFSLPGTRLALKGARAIWDAIPRIPRSLKGQRQHARRQSWRLFRTCLLRTCQQHLLLLPPHCPRQCLTRSSCLRFLQLPSPLCLRCLLRRPCPARGPA